MIMSKTNALVLLWSFYIVSVSVIFGTNKSITDILLQNIFHLKLLLFFMFFHATLSYNLTSTILKFLFTLTLIGGILSFILPGIFSAFLDHNRYSGSGIWGLSQPIGFQLNPNKLSRNLSLIVVLSPALLNMSKFNYRCLYLSSLFLIILSGSRSALAIFALLSVFNLAFNYPKEIRLITKSIIFPLTLLSIVLVAFTAMRLSNLGGADLTGENAPVFRAILLYDGFTLAIDNFPFGAGLATFGTPLSLDQVTYDKLLTGQTFFFERGTVHDINYASLLGEFGFFGAAFFLFVFHKVMVSKIYGVDKCTIYKLLLYIILIPFFESTLQSSISSLMIGLVFCLVSKFVISRSIQRNYPR